MLERKAMGQIEKCHRGVARKALLIKGARQIGKTTVVRQFARTHYKNFVELNFLEDARAHAIFDDSLDADSLVAALTSYVRKPLDPGNTLILFDEVQECPRARMAVKFLVEDGRFDYIETGKSGPILWASKSICRCIPLISRSFAWQTGCSLRL